MARVLLATPRRGGQVDAMALRSALIGASDRKHQVVNVDAKGSLLCFTFNLAWAEFLNTRADFGWFAMIHDDVCPEYGWLDKMIEKAEEEKVDVLSAVVPFKTFSGHTSTGVGARGQGDVFSQRPLTHDEVRKLPPVFRTEDVAPGVLLINTGLWVCRADRDWVEKFSFFNLDAIEFQDGKFVAKVCSEDWVFSRWLDDEGIPYAAYSGIKLRHNGEASYELTV